MEVHHHPNAEKKKFKEYFFEFLMIFLAVTLGFFAENIRENTGNHKREKEYIRSMIQDLQSDTSNLAGTIDGYEKHDKLFDTIFALYPTLTSSYNPTLINSIKRVRGYPEFVYTDKTIQQLKNSGGMNLIQNQKAVNAITEYDLNMRELGNDMAILIGFFNDVAKSWREIFVDETFVLNNPKTSGVFDNERKNYLLKTDRATLGRFYNELKDFRSICEGIKHQEEGLKRQAENLITFLRKEYHLEN